MNFGYNLLVSTHFLFHLLSKLLTFLTKVIKLYLLVIEMRQNENYQKLCTHVHSFGLLPDLWTYLLHFFLDTYPNFPRICADLSKTSLLYDFDQIKLVEFVFDEIRNTKIESNAA